MMHDLLYEYGFNEASGNYQQINQEGQGKGGDAVIARAQESSEYNQANFVTVRVDLP